MTLVFRCERWARLFSPVSWPACLSITDILYLLLVLYNVYLDIFVIHMLGESFLHRHGENIFSCALYKSCNPLCMWLKKKRECALTTNVCTYNACRINRLIISTRWRFLFHPFSSQPRRHWVDLFFLRGWIFL
jgi:hypothetical protein